MKLFILLFGGLFYYVLLCQTFKDFNLNQIIMIPTLRILTRKSKLGFGKYKDLTVQFVLENRKKYNLINPYYGLTSISYTEDILNELGITEEYRIQKPGRDAEMWRKFKTDKNMFPSLYLKPYTGSEALRKSTKPFSKGYLQNKNHGR